MIPESCASNTARIAIRYDGEPYQVLPDRTVLAALEEVGVTFVRGVGCRGGVCGACAMFYRHTGQFDLQAGLMCQDLVREGMEILPLPYFPQKKVEHDLVLPEGEGPHYRVVNLYPEVNRCIMCGECSRLCPMGIDVMGYVGMIKRGDLHGAGLTSFICIQCQVCVVRCPAQISQPNAALAARRYHGCHQVPRAEHLAKTLERVVVEEFQRRFKRLRRLPLEELRILYQSREREPDDAPPGTWLPDDRSLL